MFAADIRMFGMFTDEKADLNSKTSILGATLNSSTRNTRNTCRSLSGGRSNKRDMFFLGDVTKPSPNNLGSYISNAVTTDFMDNSVN